MLRMTTLLPALLMLIQLTVFAGRSPIVRLDKEGPRTLQMIGAMSPRMLHRISADLKPDASKVVHIQVPYYIERPKAPARPQNKKKQFQPWPPAATVRGQRFVSNSNPFQHLSGGSPIPFSPAAAFPYTPIRQSPPPKSNGLPAFEPGVHDVPGPYDTPFVPVMKPSPVNPLHREPPPEIMFEPISILPLETPSFDTLRNHVNFLKHKQAAFFEGQGREFGFGPYLGDDGASFTVHHGDDEQGLRDGGERNTLSEDDFGQNDRKYDRRGLTAGNGEGNGRESEEDDEDFYDPDGKEHDQEDREREEDDFEDSREEVRQVSTFEPKKTYTQVRHQDTVRHVPRNEVPEEDEESRQRDGDDDEADQDERNDDEEDDEDEDEDHRSRGRAPIKERVKVARKNIVYSEKGREASKFDHGSEESFGQYEQQQQQEKEQPKRKKSKRQRIKRATEDSSQSEDQQHSKEEAVPEPLIDAIILFANLTGAESLPLAEALTDPRQLHGDELIRFLDEAIQNTTQYLPEPSRNPEVISIVAPPSNVVKFPYYYRPASEIDVDSALRYAENLTTFSTGPYASRADVVCNEVDVDIADEPEPIADDGEGGFRPIKRLQGLGDKIDCLKVRHFGKEPLDNPLFREEFVGVPRQVFTVGMGAGGSKGPTVAAAAAASRQPNPAVAVYNDVIRHIKKHLASQQRRKNAKADEQETVMIAVPRVMRLPADEAAREDQHATTGVQRPTQKREARILTFPEANPTLLSNHVGIPIFDISKYFPRFMMRANDDLYADEPEVKPREPRFSTPKPTPRRSTPKAQLQSLVRTVERLAEGAVTVEENVERQLTTEKPRDDIADAFDDVLTRQPLTAGSRPLPPPIKPYDVVEHTKDDGPEPTYDKSGPPYAALALEPPVAQSILSQRLEPIKRNQLDFLKSKRATATKADKATIRKRPQRPTVTRKKVLVFYHR
ncbi:uncharacterized protein LOC118463524 [Anopheles albimanus]|uniref:Uncharacterized protein n=1 Tax=Anopheles albimanus TaxID=7167 RepID=A0A182FGK1_ANOAL|nr:uncharacterized protein LOC118463524 [Anopheles albimanus]